MELPKIGRVKSQFWDPAALPWRQGPGLTGAGHRAQSQETLQGAGLSRSEQGKPQSPYQNKAKKVGIWKKLP